LGKTLYVYDAFGKLAVEFPEQALAPCATCYLFTDQVNTTRLVLDQGGTVMKRADHMPFGEEILNGAPWANGRGSLYADNNPVRQQFTGYLRNEPYEWALDFANARYYRRSIGRFTSPDAPFADQNPASPQSWNLYSYVRNNPLVNIDPTGQDCVYTNNGDRTIGLERGDCTQKGGTFVNGTIDAKSFTYDSKTNSIGYTFTNAAEGTGGAGSIGLKNTPTRDELGLAALHRAGQLAEPGVNIAGAGLIGAGVVMGGGVAYGAFTGGTALTQLAIATLPVMPTAIDKLQKIGLSVYEAGKIVASPTAQRLIDTANGGNINVIQQVGDKLVRITLDPSGQRIISAGYIQGRNVANSIASGRFIPE
jgi:RHS repeat-associated protein